MNAQFLLNDVKHVIILIMKRFNIFKEKSPKSHKAELAADKEAVVRRATHIALDQFSKTFEDLARYDRTEKTHSVVSR
jgi:hypothetical protein